MPYRVDEVSQMAITQSWAVAEAVDARFFALGAPEELITLATVAQGGLWLSDTQTYGEVTG